MNLKLYFTCFTVFSSMYLFAQVTGPESEAEKCEGRGYYEQLKFRDPETGYIPENIRGMELAFSRRLNNTLQKRQDIDWTFRGPANIGGRTRALGIDINNEAIIVAGSTTGGMWRSSDSGASWTRTTPLSELPSVSCLVQDHRAGKTNIWYYGTGELGGNTGAYPLWLNKGPYKWGDYYGNGIYKSTDNGLTWKVLASTRNDTIGSLVQPFSFVHRIVVDNSNDSQEILYAAVAGGIERSADGGQTWNMVLGTFPPEHISTDVAITSKGVIYAVLADRQDFIGSSATAGLYRSVNGKDWVRISQAWKGYYYAKIAIAPSNENVVYLASNDTFSKATLWKYTYLSGDGSGNGGLFENRTSNLNISGGLSIAAVHPRDENVLYIGGVYLIRSSNGFTNQSTVYITPPHVDMNSICFFNNPDRMLVGCDGGIFRLDSNLGSGPWINLNSNYATTQFYTMAVNKYVKGDSAILGGMQDNSSYVTHSTNPRNSWQLLLGGDGSTCAFSRTKEEYFVSRQDGVTYRRKIDALGNVSYMDRIDPYPPGNYLWINPYVMDMNNADRMYFGGGDFVWRNDSLTRFPHNYSSPLRFGWTPLTNTIISEVGPVVGQASISAIAVSEFPPDIVYFGSTDGQLYRLDKANEGDPEKIDIWSGKGFPANAYVSSISIDSRNADRVLLAFANYNVQSLFYTEDAGKTWTAVGGNLEEFSNGKGSGPSIRAVKILRTGNDITYLAGSSTGLYSTHSLNGMSTLWELEGKDVIGNNIVNAIDARESDGFVAAGTCGNGVYSAHFPINLSTGKELSHQQDIQLSPNPSNGHVFIKSFMKESMTLKVINSLGQSVLPEQRITETFCNLNLKVLPGGMYYFVFRSEAETIVKKVILK